MATQFIGWATPIASLCFVYPPRDDPPQSVELFVLRLTFQLPDSRNSAQFIESQTLEVGHFQTMPVLMVAGILVGGFTNITNLTLLAIRRQPRSLFERWSKSFGGWTPQRRAFHPDAHPKRIERGASRLQAKPLDTITNPFDHPDAQRRFRVMSNIEELERALEFPWEKWTVFLHPSQRSLVERTYSSPTRISGSAGTGKTIVGLHRAVFLARQHPQAQILLTTFSPALANALQIKLNRLVGNQPEIHRRIKVGAIGAIAQQQYIAAFGTPHLVDSRQVRSQLIKIAAQTPELRFTESFLWSEWNEIVDTWQLTTWQAYRDVPRLGRKTRMGSKQREQLWAIFDQVHHWLEQQQQMTVSGLFRQVTAHIQATHSPFDFAVVDEAQDIGIPELRFLAAIGDQRPDSLFFTGDLGQRIFQQPFSWKSLGVDLRGRSHNLTINYRTSHQIRASADRLLPSALTDIDGNVENRRNTISVFNGPSPTIEFCDDEASEIQTVAQWIAERLKAGLQPEEIGVFVRDQAQLERAIAAITQAGATPIELNTQIAFAPERIAVSTMHLAKGLEFRAVAVMACDDEVLPLQERIEEIADESDLEEVYNTERHLLYVACTRARDYLLISGADPASEFLADLSL